MTRSERGGRARICVFSGRRRNAGRRRRGADSSGGGGHGVAVAADVVDVVGAAEPIADQVGELARLPHHRPAEKATIEK